MAEPDERAEGCELQSAERATGGRTDEKRGETGGRRGEGERAKGWPAGGLGRPARPAALVFPRVAQPPARLSPRPRAFSSRGTSRWRGGPCAPVRILPREANISHLLTPLLLALSSFPARAGHSSLLPAPPVPPTLPPPPQLSSRWRLRPREPARTA